MQKSILICIFLCLLCITKTIFGHAPLNYYQSVPSVVEQQEKFHLQHAQVNAKKGQWDYAWNEYAFLLHDYPNHPEALKLLSDLSIKMNQTERVSKYFERALSLYPEDNVTQEMYKGFLKKINQQA